MAHKVHFFIKNVVILSFIIGGVFIAKYEFARAVTFIVYIPLLLLFPRWIYKRRKLEGIFNHTFLMEIELVFLMGVFLAVIGEGFIYDNLPGFDSLVHFINGALITFVVVALNHERWLDRKISPLRTVFLAGFLPGVANEIYEFSADQLFGTKLWGDVFKPLWLDTISDVLFQILGSIIAILILKKLFHHWLKRWGVT